MENYSKSTQKKLILFMFLLSLLMLLLSLPITSKAAPDDSRTEELKDIKITKDEDEGKEKIDEEKDHERDKHKKEESIACNTDNENNNKKLKNLADDVTATVNREGSHSTSVATSSSSSSGGGGGHSRNSGNFDRSGSHTASPFLLPGMMGNNFMGLANNMASIYARAYSPGYGFGLSGIPAAFGFGGGGMLLSGGISSGLSLRF